MAADLLLNDTAADAQSIPLFIAEIEQLGGAERSMLALARWLYTRGIAAHLLTYADHCNFAQFADFPLKIVVLSPAGGFRAKLKCLRSYFRQRNAVAQTTADSLAGGALVVGISKAKLRVAAPAPLVSGYQPALHATLAGVHRFHCLMHDTPALFGDEAYRTMLQRLRISVSNKIIGFGMRRGRGRMIVTSEFLQRDCWREFGVRASLARMGGLGAPGGFRRRPVEGTLRLLSVCRIEPNKRIDWMLDALAAMEKAEVPLSKRIDWRFDLAGKGSLLEHMRRRAAELGLAGRVHFHGFVPDAELETLYDQAHLFLMPAVQGYGIPAIEALERGIPVVLHRESGVSDILSHTPWASVLRDGPQELLLRLETMIDFLLRNGQMTAPPPPDLPTEDGWAERVATVCEYI
jgi:glycosyltransferase involved in cell wall biosynthesis